MIPVESEIVKTLHMTGLTKTLASLKTWKKSFSQLEIANAKVSLLYMMC